MGVVAIKVVVIVAIMSFASVAYADKGTATYYTPPYVPSACDGYKDDGVMIAPLATQFWDNKAACGRSIKYKCTGATNDGVHHPCTGQSVVVRIVLLSAGLQRHH
ncbi:EG45-like domain containing protein [Sesamum alatum]|uniref:EG45-like domain containing protein n=1 Tax=Sesamum alatum TaxID=300844 RepID=A0AAE2CAR6_9LAMI|nr:EG45-like domain containing protein [Sesamum alatum]